MNNTLSTNERVSETKTRNSCMYYYLTPFKCKNIQIKVLLPFVSQQNTEKFVKSKRINEYVYLFTTLKSLLRFYLL